VIDVDPNWRSKDPNSISSEDVKTFRQALQYDPSLSSELAEEGNGAVKRLDEIRHEVHALRAYLTRQMEEIEVKHGIKPFNKSSS
jgi:hypothetical protein